MARENWSAAEQWVWERTRAGEVADFNVWLGEGGVRLNARSPGGWDDRRLLGATFLREIFGDKALRGEMPAEGVRIAGALFRGKVVLSFLRLDRQLWLEESRFESAVEMPGLVAESWLSFEKSFIAKPGDDSPSLNLNGASVKGYFSLAECAIDGWIDMTSVKAGHALCMDGATVSGTMALRDLTADMGVSMEGSIETPAIFNDIDLTNAVVARLSFVGARVNGRLSMGGLQAGHLRMDGAPEAPTAFKDVDLRGAKVSGTICLYGAKVEGALALNDLDAGHVLMQGSIKAPATFRQVDLTGARIRGQLSLLGANVDGKLTMNGLEAGHLLMHSDIEAPAAFGEVDLTVANIRGQLSFIGATVDGNLTMNGLEVGHDLLMRSSKETLAKFKDIDLTNANVGGQLDLGGANVDGKLMMSGLAVGHDLLMRGSRDQPSKFAEVNMTSAKINGQLNLYGATVGGKLTMNDVAVGRDLLMCGSKDQPSKFAEVDMINAKVNGQLNLISASVDKKLAMNGLGAGLLFMGGSADMPSAFKKEIDLTSASISGQMNLVGARIDGKLIMNGLVVGQDLLMRGSKDQPSTFAEVDLTGAKVKSQLSLRAANVSGNLTMMGLEVEQDLIMRSEFSVDHDIETRSTFVNVDLSRAKIGGGITLSGANIAGSLKLDRTQIGTDLDMQKITCEPNPEGKLRVAATGAAGKAVANEASPPRGFDLTGARVAGELRLCSLPGNCNLILRNTQASVLVEDGTWPRSLELDGFRYARLDEIGTGAWRQRYLENWLARDTSYTPQPYEQLAAAFRGAGRPDMASNVLFAGRERARRLARRHARIFPGWRYIGLTLLKWTIGYGLGYRYFWSLWWVGILTCLGVIVLQFDACNIHGAESLVYSFQKLLPPFAKLEELKNVRIGVFARWYFYVHQLIGFVLAGFLTAGLAGLTQKS